MKKREIFLIFALVLFGLVYQAVEKGKLKITSDFSFYSEERKLRGNRFREFPEAEKLYAGVARVTVENPAGEVVVGRSDDGQVHLVSLLRVYYAGKDDVEILRRGAGVKADLENGELKVSVTHASPFPYRHLRFLFRLMVPADTVLAVSNREGDVIIKEAGKAVQIDQENGKLLLQGLGSTLDAHLRNCAANIVGVAEHAEISASHSQVVLENAAALKLGARHGDCLLKNVAGNVFADYAFGKLTIDGAGKVEVSARHSEINVRNIRDGAVVSGKYGGMVVENTAGDLRLSGRSSRIDLRQAAGENVVIENSFADIEVLDFSGKNLDVLIKNGRLDLSVKNVAERINVQAQQAELSLALGALPDPTINIRARHGRIILDSPLELEEYEENEIRFANRAGQKPEILINSAYGDIHLRTARE